MGYVEDLSREFEREIHGVVGRRQPREILVEKFGAGRDDDLHGPHRSRIGAGRTAGTEQKEDEERNVFDEPGATRTPPGRSPGRRNDCKKTNRPAGPSAETNAGPG